MSDPASPSRPVRSARAKARREAADRAARVFSRLRAGMSVWNIARFENCSVRTVRRIVAGTLARLEIDPTVGYAQLQIARLNDAMMVAHVKMIEDGDMKALDRVLKIVESQDRYHGFGRPGGAAPVADAPARLPCAERPLRLAKPVELRALAPPSPPEEEEIDADTNRVLTSGKR